MDDLLRNLPVIAQNVALAAIVLVAGYFLGRLVRILTNKVIDRGQIAQALGPSMAQLISSALYWLILLMTGIISLAVLGVPDQIVIAVFIVVVAVIGFLAFALQQSLSNVAATIIFLLFQPFKRGEVVETMGRTGTVRELLPFNTVLELPDHRLVSLPNSKIQESGIVNYTRLGRIWADFMLSVAYDEDLDRVRAIIAEIAANDSRIASDPPLEISVEDFGERGVRLNVCPTVAPEHASDVRSDLRAQIKARFDAEGIRFAIIPMPTR